MGCRQRDNITDNRINLLSCCGFFCYKLTTYIQSHNAKHILGDNPTPYPFTPPPLLPTPTLCHKQNLNNHRGMIMHRTYQQIKTELMIYKNSFTVHTHEVGLGDITIATWLIYFSIDYWSVLFFHFFCGLVQRGNRPPTQVNEPWIHLNLFLNPLQCQT